MADEPDFTTIYNQAIDEMRQEFSEPPTSAPIPRTCDRCTTPLAHHPSYYSLMLEEHGRYVACAWCIPCLRQILTDYRQGYRNANA